jgi:hypothetical protein
VPRISRSWIIWLPLLLVIVLLYAVLGSWLLTFIVILLVAGWLAFFKRTWCDVEKSNGKPCESIVRGKLRACRWHKRQKRDAIWAYFRLINPGQRFRIMWSRATGRPANITPMPAEPTSRVRNPIYDAAILIAAVVSALGTVAAIFVQVASSS